MDSTVLVIGATGNVGREVLKLLSAQNYPVAAATRNPANARNVLGDGVRVVEFDFNSPGTFTNAFLGVKKLFLVRPPAIANLSAITPALNAAKQAGVEEIVFLSILGADRNRIVPHYAIERAIERLNIPAVFLRAGFFMQNLNTVHREDICTRSRLFMPAGKGKTSFIDVRDIASVAVKILTKSDGSKDSSNRIHAYALTGEQALDYYEVATIFTAVLGKTVTYDNPSLLVFIQQMLQQGLPLQFVLVMTGIYTTTRLGLADTITSDVRQLLDRPPTTMQQYVEDYRQCWL
jgi:uncharacterized protein YbjT (DUF2867 family)